MEMCGQTGVVLDPEPGEGPREGPGEGAGGAGGAWEGINEVAGCGWSERAVSTTCSSFRGDWMLVEGLVKNETGRGRSAASSMDAAASGGRGVLVSLSDAQKGVLALAESLFVYRAAQEGGSASTSCPPSFAVSQMHWNEVVPVPVPVPAPAPPPAAASASPAAASAAGGSSVTEERDAPRTRVLTTLGNIAGVSIDYFAADAATDSAADSVSEGWEEEIGGRDGAEGACREGAEGKLLCCIPPPLLFFPLSPFHLV